MVGLDQEMSKAMQFRPTALAGAYLVELQPIADERGFFARAFSEQEFEQLGLVPHVAQANLSFNSRRGTLRGFHYQSPPAGEAKLIRCVRGAMYNVVVDMRESSASYLQHFAVELSAENRLALYVPPECATAMQTLVDNTEAYYQVSAPYTPELERGLRYDDPHLGVRWPLPITEVSAKDQAWPLLAGKS
jgi:dTDP-4-dehydrorhamnose 3,5-epimerase